MSFKDMISADLNIFLNIDEFGEIHNIDGKDYTLIIDNDQLKERSKKEYDGISVGEVLFFVTKEAFGKKPSPGSPMTFNSKQMYVFDSREDMGMYEIILSQNRSG